MLVRSLASCGSPLNSKSCPEALEEEGKGWGQNRNGEVRRNLLYVGADLGALKFTRVWTSLARMGHGAAGNSLVSWSLGIRAVERQKREGG